MVAAALNATKALLAQALPSPSLVSGRKVPHSLAAARHVLLKESICALYYAIKVCVYVYVST